MIQNKILEIKWYVIPMFFCVFTLIVFENFWIFLLCIILLQFFYIFLWKKYKNEYFKIIIPIIWSLSLIGWFLFNLNLEKTSFYQKSFVKKNFKIVETYKKWQYILEDDFWNQFLWKNLAKNYQLWDIIKVYWYVVPISWKNIYPIKNFFNTDLNVKNIKKIHEFDYNKWLKMKQLAWTIYVKKEYLKKSKPNFFENIKNKVVRQVRQLYTGYDDKYKALVLWLLLWDKSLLDKDLYQQFIHSGLVHIIVVSWGNMMFFIIFLWIILFFLPFYIRLIVIGIFLIFYAIIVWWDSSVIRALIMWLLSLLALFLWKEIAVERLLWIAFILMLVYNPYFLIYDLWFILSFLAIIWILYFNNFQIDITNTKKLIFLKIKELDKLDNNFNKIKLLITKWSINFYNNYILPTLWASLFTAPAILFFTKQVNILAFLASIVVIPFVPIIMFLNIIALILFNLNLDIAYQIVYISKPLLNLVFLTANVFSEKLFLFIKI